MDLRCILHPTDFSRHSESAYRMACALARDYNARLLVVHVAPLPPIGSTAMVPMPPPAEAYREPLETHLRQFQAPDPRVHLEHRLELGDTVTGILAVAQEASCDLIVMGTHGRTGLGRLLMGSVAEQVLRQALCPVLVVKTPFQETCGSPKTRPEAVGTTV